MSLCNLQETDCWATTCVSFIFYINYYGCLVFPPIPIAVFSWFPIGSSSSVGAYRVFKTFSTPKKNFKSKRTERGMIFSLSSWAAATKGKGSKNLGIFHKRRGGKPKTTEIQEMGVEQRVTRKDKYVGTTNNKFVCYWSLTKQLKEVICKQIICKLTLLATQRNICHS